MAIAPRAIAPSTHFLFQREIGIVLLVLFLSRVFFFGVAWLGLQVNTEQSVKTHPDAF